MLYGFQQDKLYHAAAGAAQFRRTRKTATELGY